MTKAGLVPKLSYSDLNYSILDHIQYLILNENILILKKNEIGSVLKIPSHLGTQTSPFQTTRETHVKPASNTNEIHIFHVKVKEFISG